MHSQALRRCRGCAILYLAIASGCGWFSSQSTPNDRYSSGLKQLKAHDEHAIATFDKLSSENPHDARAIYYRAVAYDEAKQTDKALSGYSAAITMADKIATSPGIEWQDAVTLLDEDRAKVYTRRGAIYRANGELDPAIDDYTAAILLNPTDAAAFRGRGGAFLEKGFSDVAVDDLTIALKLDATSAEAALNRGRAYLKIGKPTEAADDCRLAIRLDPKNAAAYRALGEAYVIGNRPRYDLAIGAFQEAKRRENHLDSAVNLQIASAYRNWSAIWDAAGKTAEAEHALAEAAKLNPAYEAQHDQYVLAHAETATQTQSPSLAKPITNPPYRVGYRGDPDLLAKPLNAEAVATSDQATELLKDQKYDEAIELFTRSLASDPNISAAWYGRGLAYLESNFPDNAVEDFNNALNLSSEPADVYLQRGRAYALQGKEYIAVQDFTQAIRLKPEFSQAYYQRGLAHLASRYFGRAIADLDEAAKLEPAYKEDVVPLVAKAYRGRGVDQTTFGNFAAAIRDLDQSMELVPGVAKNYHARGNVYFKLGNWNQAVADYNQAIRLDPNLESYELRSSLRDAELNASKAAARR